MEKCCPVCLSVLTPSSAVELPCKHIFCPSCIKSYITTLKDLRSLKPTNIVCLHQECSEPIPDSTLNKSLPATEAMLVSIIRKKYQDSKDPYNLVFTCQGLCGAGWKQLIKKETHISREQHSRQTLQLIAKIRNKQVVMQSTECPSVITIHKITDVGRKDPIMCFKCGVSYCKKCFNLNHDGKCPPLTQQYIPKKTSTLSTQNKQLDFGEYIKSSNILECMNPRCGLPIEREAGCYFVKCFCGWEMCYPCKTLWGDCLHFQKYTYGRFTPPPEWMEKMLGRRV